MSDDPDFDVTEVSVSAGRKVQLDQYEPINEQATVTADVPDGEDPEDIMEKIRELAWDECERGVMKRYEEHVRDEAFGE